MSDRIIICLDGYTLLPIEYKEKVLTLQIAVAVKPTTEEMLKLLISKDPKIQVVNEITIKGD